MRINNNLMALNNQRQRGINHINTVRNIERLSSGLRINRAADNAANLAISERMRAQIGGLNMAGRNAQDAVSLLQVAEGGLQTIQNALHSLRELAVQAASDTNTAFEREAMDTVSSLISEEITDIAESTQFNTMPLLDGSLAQDDPQIPGVDYRGPLVIQVGANQNDTTTIDINAVSAEALGVQHAANPGDEGVSVATREAASNSIGAIDDALNQVSMQRAEIGARQNAMEFRMQNLSVQAENTAAAESRIRDTDMAREMISFTTNQILNHASMALAAQANAVPTEILRLISS